MTKKKPSGKRLGIKELIISLLLIFLVWVAEEYLGLNLLPSNSAPVVETEATGAIQVTFTSPRYPDEESYHYGGLDEKLAAAIDAAQERVDMAAFDFDLERVADALIRADQRGVRVRLVTDTDYEDEVGPTRLRRAGIEVVTDERGAFMHDKFVIIDDFEVWTGSWNLTDNGTYRNNNNVVVIESQKLAENYTAEFEEMFLDRAFGVTSPDETPYPLLDLSGIRVENYFEAEGAVQPRIVELISDAENSVYFMAFAFTDDDIARAMIDRHRAGVDVAGVMEARNVSGIGSEFETLRRGGVDIVEDGNPYVMHHKVIVIDGTIVITGSYNFTASAADNNDENVLIIHSPEIAEQYLQEFDRRYEEAQNE